MSEKEHYGALRDSAGNLSSKRIAGFSILVLGSAYLLTIGIVSIFRMVADSSTALDVGRVLIFTGGGLLGVGVVEKFGGNK
jgi:hypothetical protein